MPDYRDAIKKVLEHEGGFANHKADKGGITMYGVTRKVYEEFIGKKFATDAEAIAVMKAMPIGNAITIYKKNYWDKIQGDKIKPYAVAAAIFDQAINRGHVAAIKQAQKVLGLAQDGIMGKGTLDKINLMQDKFFIPAYIAESVNAYKTIVAKNPSQAVFLDGWLKRAASLQKYATSFFGSVNATTVVGISVGVMILVGIGGYVIYNYMKTPTQTARTA